MAARARKHDYIWHPFISACSGTPLVHSCAAATPGTKFRLLDNGSWQPDAATGQQFDRATLKRIICHFTWTGASELNNDSIICGIVKVDAGVATSGTIGTQNYWLPSTWSNIDALWGPHVQSIQAFMANPLTIDVQTQRKIDTNDEVYFLVEGTSDWTELFGWVSGRILVERT